jgi:hypothetical protein
VAVKRLLKKDCLVPSAISGGSPSSVIVSTNYTRMHFLTNWQHSALAYSAWWLWILCMRPSLTSREQCLSTSCAFWTVWMRPYNMNWTDGMHCSNIRTPWLIVHSKCQEISLFGLNGIQKIGQTIVVYLDLMRRPW